MQLLFSMMFPVELTSRAGLITKRKNGRYNFYKRTESGTEKLTQIGQNEGDTQLNLEGNVYRL
ncbi:MAG: hypothetical protein ACTSQQ_09985 [Candidatus Helarchaeota archaeon]